MKELLAAVVDSYEETGELKLTAEEFGMSALKIRKLLITAGAYHNDLSDQVNDLFAQGKTVAEIGQIIGLGKAHEKYETLVDQMSELIMRRYPERQEEAVKNRLYEAYRKSGKTLDFIIDFIEHAPKEDDFWN